MSKDAFLLFKSDERFTVVIDNKPYILIQQPVCTAVDCDGDVKLIKGYQTGRAVIYVDDGQEKVIFEADVDDALENMNLDGIEVEQSAFPEFETFDVVWFI
jgi:hypothetical protein